MALLFVATSRYGAGIGPDSVVYLSAAENLLRGLGFTALSWTGEMGPMTRFPPLFPALLSAAGALGLPPEAAARWLNVLVFGANITLAGVLVEKCTASARLAALTALLMLLSVDMLHVHSMIMTEGIFIFFTLLTVFYSVEHYKNSRPISLAAAAGAAALAVLTRYSGVALVAASAAGLVFLGRQPRVRTRLANAAVFSAVSLLPLLLWILRNLRVAGNAADRPMVFHPVAPHKYADAVFIFAGWLAPVNVSAAAGIIVLLSEAAAVLVLGRLLLQSGALGARSAPPYHAKVPQLLSFYALSYAALVLAAITFFDAGVQLRIRTLSLIYPVCLIAGVSLGWRWCYPIKNTGTFKAVAAVLAAVLAGYYLFSAAVWTADVYANGQRYNGREWRQSELMDTVRDLPPETLIYTNGPDVIRTLTGRRTRRLPAKAKLQTGLASGAYLSEIAGMQEELGKNGGVIVYFDRITTRWYLPSQAELKKQLQLNLLKQTADGSVYTLAAAQKY